MVFEAIVLLILTFSKFSSSYECNERYLNISPQHTMCQKPNPQCKIREKILSKDDQDLIVKVHNELRSKLATGKEQRAGNMPPAADMVEMEWDDELAAIAQKHAEMCTFMHDCRKCRSVDRFSVGQNIAMWTSIGIPKKDFRESITKFYEEVKYFDKNLIASFKPSGNSNNYDHFTQVVWSKSWKIGCGYAQFDNALNWITGLLICNYGPAGNVLGKRIYKEGDPCSACPLNSCCGEKCALLNITATYPGLCKLEAKPPYYILEEPRSNTVEPRRNTVEPPKNMKAGELLEHEKEMEEILRNKRIMILLSQNDINNNFLMEIVKHAFFSSLEEKMFRLILIMVGDHIPPLSDVDQSLKAAIQSARCLRLGEKMLWDMLRFAMSKKQAQQRY